MKFLKRLFKKKEKKEEKKEEVKKIPISKYPRCSVCNLEIDPTVHKKKTLNGEKMHIQCYRKLVKNAKQEMKGGNNNGFI